LKADQEFEEFYQKVLQQDQDFADKKILPGELINYDVVGTRKAYEEELERLENMKPLHFSNYTVPENEIPE
jgi:hypothetical protein